MLIAGIGSLLATLLANGPVLLTINSSQAGAAQSGLISTAVHLMGHVAVAGIVIMGHLQVGNGFVYWLMAFYLTTLVILSATLVRVIRLAPMDKPLGAAGSEKQ